MTRHFAAIGAVIRKDLTLLWPLAVVAMLWPLVIRPLQAAGPPFDPSSVHPILATLRVMVPTVAQLLSLLLALLFVHTDPATSLRHDWLTRPIPRLGMVLAKALLLAVVVLGPWLVGQTLVDMGQGAPLVEALLAAFTRWPILLLILPVLALVCVTADLFELGGLVLGLVVLIIVVVGPPGRELLGEATRTSSSGAAWIVVIPNLLMLLAAAVLVLWLQYGRRRTLAARATIVLAATAGILLSNYFPWKTVFAAQVALSPDPGAGARVRIALEGGCLPVRTVFGETSPEPWSKARIAEAGPQPLAISTPFAAAGAPATARLVVDYVTARYEGPTGRALAEPALAVRGYEQIVRPGSADVGKHQWLLSRAEEARLRAAGAHLRLDYSLSLLTPVAQASLPVDGRRRHLPGFGWCRASLKGGRAIEAVCLDLIGHPARLEMSLEGAPEAAPVVTGDASYSPAWMDIVGGRRVRKMQATGSGPWRIKLTNYEAAAHFERTLTTNGVLGAPGGACPPPT